ncbi:MAG TPA: hypothetical protein VF543_16030 [Pyrinomonadaceae bacterium]
MGVETGTNPITNPCGLTSIISGRQSMWIATGGAGGRLAAPLYGWHARLLLAPS